MIQSMIRRYRDAMSPVVGTLQLGSAIPHMPVEDITAEFELLIKLKHPKIARYYEIFQDYNNFYIVSEPYFGGDLTKLVATASTSGVKVTEAWLARIILQIAQGVSFLHS